MPLPGITREIFRFDGSTSPDTGSEFNPQRAASDMGVVQVSWAGATDGSERFLLEIQGKVSPTHGWAKLESFDETDLDPQNEIVKPVRLMPIMRARLKSVTGVGTMSADDIIASIRE